MTTVFAALRAIALGQLALWLAVIFLAREVSNLRRDRRGRK